MAFFERRVDMDPIDPVLEGEAGAKVEPGLT